MARINTASERRPSSMDNENAEQLSPTDGPDSSSSSTKVPEETVVYPGPLQLVMVMTAVITTVFVIALDQTIVATAIPRITDEFKGLDKVSWYGSAYFLTTAGTIPSWGKAFRYIPLKTAFLTAFFIFELGSLICGVAPNANALIAGRAIAGLGCGGLMTGCFMMMTFALPPATRAMGFSTVVTGYGVAAACGPLIGGAFTGHVSWRWCFYINLPIGALTLAAIVFSPKLAAAKTMPASYTEILKQLDLAGVALLMGAIVAIILALQFGGQTMPWSSSTVIGLLVGFGLILAAFAAWQVYLGEEAVMVPRLMRQHSIWAPAAFQFSYAGAYFVALYQLPIYFQSISGVSPSESGVRNLPLVLAVCLISIPTGKLLGMWPRATSWFKTGCSAVVAITCGLFYTMDGDTSTGEWIGFQILAGAAWATAWQCSLLEAQAGKNFADLPLATSTVNLAQSLGGAIGVSIAQTLFNNRLLAAVAVHAPSVDPEKVLTTGATELRTAFPPEDVPGVLAAYLDGLRWVWIFTIAMAGFAFLVSLTTYLVKQEKVEGDRDGSDVAAEVEVEDKKDAGMMA